MEKVELLANIRKEFSKSSRTQMRKNGRIPGVFYSKNDEPVAIEVAELTLNPLVFTSQTHLVSLKLQDDRIFDCIVKDIQFDPVTDKVVHFDLLGLTKGEKLQIEVPVQFTGAAEGIKAGGLLQQVLHKLEIECFPKDMPDHLEVDVTPLQIGDAIHAGDLSFENVTILTPKDAVVVTVTHVRAEKEVTDETLQAPLEPEVIAKGKVEEEE